MRFITFDSKTGDVFDDSPSFPEQILGSRWSESSVAGRVTILIVSMFVLLTCIGVAGSFLFLCAQSSS